MPRLLAPYVTFVALITLMAAEYRPFGVALLLALGFAVLFPGPLVAATIVRVRRDRAMTR